MYKFKLKESKDLIPGGLAKGKTLEDIAKKHKYKVSTIHYELEKGIKVEMEHTTDEKIAREIAMDHLWEDPKYYDKLAKIEENEDETTSPDSETGGGNGEKIVKDLKLTPKVVSVEEVVTALETLDNYGPYISNLRNTKSNVEKEIEKHFGPSQRFSKIKAEKERGKPFPPKTKQAIDDFIRTLTSKPNLLKWKVEGDSLIFQDKNNPTKKVTTNIIDTVLRNAGIDYNLENEEQLDESRLTIAIKEAIKKVKLTETINFGLTGKIYDILVKEVPEVGKKFTKSSFGLFLDKNIKQ